MLIHVLTLAHYPDPFRYYNMEFTHNSQVFSEYPTSRLVLHILLLRVWLLYNEKVYSVKAEVDPISLNTGVLLLQWDMYLTAENNFLCKRMREMG